MKHRMTPLMGWASWNCFRTNISEQVMKEQAELLVSTGLAECGYTYVNMDDGFFGGRDEKGKLLYHPTRFPQGVRPLADYIHHLGLQAGIYSDTGDNTCGHYYDHEGGNGIGAGLFGHEEQDLRQLLIEEDFDFIKVDWCGGVRLGLDEEEQYTKIGKIIELLREEKGRDLIYNICRWQFPGAWASQVADSWRTGADIAPDFASVIHQLDMIKPLARYCRPGHVNDLDMMQIGNGLTYEEEKTHFTMWCMMSTPLMLGCDLHSIKSDTLELLKNKKLIAINQDMDCKQAYVIKTVMEQDHIATEVWLKELHDQEKAIAFLNRSSKEQEMSIHFEEAGLLGNILSIEEVMNQNNFKMTKEGIEAMIPPHSVMVFRIKADKNINVKNEFDVGEFKWKKDIFIDTVTCQKLLANEAVLVDVRTPEEYKESHLDTAINFPYMDIHAIGQEYLTDKKKDIILYCASGKRCSQAKRSLEYLGYENLYLYKM